MYFPKILFFFLYLTITTFSFGEKILFIGNSYTSQCSRSIIDLFKNESPEWELTFHTKGGKDLAYHLADPTTKPMILSQKWDFVVLQEQSQKSGLGGKFSQGFRDAVNSFSTMIRKNGSTPCLYLTWGRKAGDKKNPNVYPDFQTMQKKIAYAILKRGRKAEHVFSQSASLIQKSNSKTRLSLKAFTKETAATPLKLDPILYPQFFGVV